MRFAFIRDHRGEFPIDLMCAVLGVSRSGFYAWIGRPPSPAAGRRERLAERIREVHAESRCTYGSPRVYRELAACGVACCEHTVAKLMREQEIHSKARGRLVVRTTDSRHDRPTAGNVLAREFYAERPDAGWATAYHLRAELPIAALRMALAHRRPAGALLHHSDRGVQYASDAYQSLLAGHGIEPSMSRVSDCWDNAVAESFFSTLKRELVHHEEYADHGAAHRSLFEYIEAFYNRRRRHSTLGYRSPAEYEARLR